MKKLARILNGIVVELFDEFQVIGDSNVHISERFHPDFISALVEVPGTMEVFIGDTYIDGQFGPPPVKPAVTYEEAWAQRDYLIALATMRINPLQDAVDLEEATDEEIALLKKWKKYRVELNRVQNQPEFPTNIQWPESP